MSLVHLDGPVWGLSITDDGYLDPGLVDVLHAARARAESDEGIGALVLLGGERSFCVGARLDALRDPEDNATHYAPRLPMLLAEMPVPVVACAEGHAIGGGFVLALLGDGVALSESALYGANFMALGFTPGMGSTAVLEPWLGRAMATDLLFSGRLVTGSELRSTPLSPYVHPADEVRDEALELAHRLAQAPRRSVVALRRCLASRRASELGRAVTEERAMHAQLLADPEIRAAIDERYGT